MARKKSSPAKKPRKARIQPPKKINAALKKRLDEDPRFNPQLFEPKRRKLEVLTDEKNGYDYISLDVLTSAYLDRIRDIPHFPLVSPEARILPMQGVIIPLCEFGQQDTIFELERRAIRDCEKRSYGTRFGEPAKHERVGRHIDEGFGVSGFDFVVAGEATIAAQPSEGPLHPKLSTPSLAPVQVSITTVYLLF